MNEKIEAPVEIRCLKHEGEVFISKPSLVLFLYKIKDVCSGKYDFFVKEIINEIEKL